MAKRKRTNAPSYTEAQTKAWLTWLARGMQRHRQTLFMIEQLQPSWLSTRLGRCTYILSSRLIVGLIFGVIFELIYERTTGIHKGLFHWTIVGPCFGLYVGLIVGFMDAVRLNRSVNRSNEEDAPTGAQLAISALNTSIGGGWGCLGCFGCLGVIALIALLVFLPERSEQIDQTAGQIVVLAFAMLFSALAFVFLWRIRGTQRVVTRDIQPVETLRWSWKHAAKGGGDGFRLGPFFGRKIAVYGGLIGGATGGMIGGIAIGENWEWPLPRPLPGLVVGFTAWLCLRLAAGIRGVHAEKPTTTVKAAKVAFRRTAFVGSIVALVCALISIFSWSSALFAVLFGVLIGVLVGIFGLGVGFGLPVGLVFGLILGVYGGLRPGIQEMKTTPNQGMRLTLKSAFLAGLVFSMFFAVPVGLICGAIGGAKLGLNGALVIALAYGLFTGL